MTRHFNTIGSNRPEDHYGIDPLERIDWPKIQRLIDRNLYFTLHAPRQSGKTDVLRAIVKKLNGTGRYQALCVDLELARKAYRMEDGIQVVVGRIEMEAKYSLPGSWLANNWRALCSTEYELMLLLQQWAANTKVPTVLLLDEIDAVEDDPLVSVIRQLEAGYESRFRRPFPQSVILCGVRDVRNRRTHDSKGELITGGRGFYIKFDSVRLENFSETEVQSLYGQHTAETGQIFEESIFPRVMAMTGGQPWLVNALARELTEKMPVLQDHTRPITLEDVEEAKDRIVLKCDEMHLKPLVGKLEQPRVRSVIEPMLKGELWISSVPSVLEEDCQYVADLGLIVTRHPEVNRRPDVPRISNEIYGEALFQALTSTTRRTLDMTISDTAFVLPDGRLDVRGMLEGFQQFYRENSEQAPSPLLLQAWLHRVVNGRGRIERAYALADGCVDFFVRFFRQVDGERVEQRFVVEMKARRSSREATISDTIAGGLMQTADYASKCNPDETHLIVVDSTPEKSWDEKIFVKECSIKECHVDWRSITAWGI